MGKRPVSFLSIASLAVLPFLGAGCATFVKFSAEGTGAANTFVRVNSVPQGIQGTLDSGRTFTTPVNLVLKSDQEHTLTFTKEGSEPVVIRLEPETNDWIWGNILSLGIGCFVDDEKGSMSTLCPDDVLVTFEEMGPEPEAAPEPESTEEATEGTSA